MHSDIHHPKTQSRAFQDGSMLVLWIQSKEGFLARGVIEQGSMEDMAF